MSHRRTFPAGIGIVLAAIVASFTALPALAADGWHTDAKKAIAEARKTNRIILMNFTGSDWCPPCQRLHREVYETREFIAWASDNVVLLELDFPRSKPQNDQLKQQNQELSKKYAIRGFPTAIFVDADGKELSRSVGYVPGGAANWIKNADAIVQANTVRLTPLNSLPAGIESAKAFGRSILLIVAPQADDAVAALFRNKALADLIKGRMVVVHLAGKLTAIDEKALADLRTAHQLSADATQVAAIDLQKDQPLFASASVPEPARLVKALRDALPELTYSGEWLEDFERAERIASELGRPMVLLFTGSDWSPNCIKLAQEVLATDAVKQFGADKAVLMKVDSPRKTPQGEELKKQNAAMTRRFGVSAYPTFMVISPDGKRLGQVGYVAGGAEPLIAKLQELLSKAAANAADGK